VVELLQQQEFLVTDPGLVESIVVRMRLRLTDRLPLETLREIGEELDVTYVMMGTVNEFGFVQARGGNLPGVSVTLRIVTCANGRIVWAASHAKRGDDAETVFGLGRIESVEQLAAVTVQEMIGTLSE